ncbi:uncharacterized protein [Procambarus clarkii]|uniref:uncharacterized protein isoform X2 n=1 Tax=Procambarus clarkii TaxID=6728 RepID=UPI001E675C0C|nr:uncharacterized protein LOC123761334 isoform X2 [Procambarus clarkii]
MNVKMVAFSRKMKGKMAEINAKMKNKGYNPFGYDDSKNERRKVGTSTTPGIDHGKGGGVMALLKGLCCSCFSSDHHHPLLAASKSPVVTHRKISRVASTESLAKEGLELSECPNTNLTPHDKLMYARVLSRLNANSPATPTTHNGVTTLAKTTTQTVTAHHTGLPTHTLALSKSASSSSNQLFPSTTLPPSTSSQSILSASPNSHRRFPVTPSDSPRPERPSHTQRPTQLSLSIPAARSRGSITPTPSAGSPASTPTTPRSRSGSWGVVRAGFTSLMKAMTSHHRTDSSTTVAHPDEDEDVCGGDKEVPQAACITPVVGGVSNPARECYGSLTLKIHSHQGRWVRVRVCQLAGLPWVGGSGELKLEVSVEPGSRTHWLDVPHSHGPNVIIKQDALVKTPRESKTKKKSVVKVSVWVRGRLWRYAAIGHALTPLTQPAEAVTLPLHHHTRMTDDLGVVEVSLRCDYADNEAVGPEQGEVVLTLEVLRSRILRLHHPSVLSKAAPSRKKDHVEVVCRVGLWVKGERIEKESSTPVQLPVTQDPVFRCRSVFVLHRDSLQHAAIILKVLYTSKWGVEDTVGRVQLGPLLYLGTSPCDTSQTPDYNTSITLSHWGQALKRPGPTTIWHHLQL